MYARLALAFALFVTHTKVKTTLHKTENLRLPGVYIQPSSQNLVRGKKSAPKKEGGKISKGNDDKKGINGKRGKKRE